MHTESEEIIRYIWGRQGGDYAFYSNRVGGRWKDTPIHISDFDVPSYEGDQYFTPLTFVEPHRSNDTVAPAGVLFADLDPVDPTSLSIRPSLAWETSPGNYQALWLIGDSMGYSQFANLNRRLTILTGADPGGWMGSKLLRVPGTTNHKYNPSRPGRLLWWNLELVYWSGDLDERFPAIPNRPDVGAGGHPEYMNERDGTQFINDRWESLPLRARSMLMQVRVPDRSLHIVRVIHELLKTGMATNTVYNMIWWRPWNKWRTDRHNPDQLWAEINRAKLTLVD